MSKAKKSLQTYIRSAVFEFLDKTSGHTCLFRKFFLADSNMAAGISDRVTQRAFKFGSNFHLTDHTAC